MPYTLDDKLVVGITSRALFDLHESDEIYQHEGLDAYRAHQRENENVTLAPGTGLPLVRGLLSINQLADEHMVEVIILSRNDADSGLRIMKSVAAHGLDISRAAFRGGEDPTRYLKAFDCDIFLSAEPEAVRGALDRKVPAALVLAPPEALDDDSVDQVRIAFDGDAVLFGAESERYFQRYGLEAFQEREKELADRPMDAGPLKPFLIAVGRIQARFPERDSPIRTALVTARNAPAHERVINTFRAWNVRVDESLFLGGIDKAEIVAAMRPHIFFDDQIQHLEAARRRTPSAHVLSAVGEQAEMFPAGTAVESSSDESPHEAAPPAEQEAQANDVADPADGAETAAEDGASVTPLRPPRRDVG